MCPIIIYLLHVKNDNKQIINSTNLCPALGNFQVSFIYYLFEGMKIKNP